MSLQRDGNVALARGRAGLRKRRLEDQSCDASVGEWEVSAVCLKIHPATAVQSGCFIWSSVNSGCASVVHSRD